MKLYLVEYEMSRYRLFLDKNNAIEYADGIQATDIMPGVYEIDEKDLKHVYSPGMIYTDKLVGCCG